jgi:hypothetical protein
MDKSLSGADTLFVQYDYGELFESEELLEICLTGAVRKLFNDRKDDAIYHPMVLSYTSSNRERIELKIRVKTRGYFRRDRNNCATPPLWLKFASDDETRDTLFSGQTKLKLVTACRDEKYVLREYLVYKLYNLITDKSFRVRLVKVCYEDVERGKKTQPLFGILLESTAQLARRNQGQLVKMYKLQPKNTNPRLFLKMAVFHWKYRLVGAISAQHPIVEL